MFRILVDFAMKNRNALTYCKRKASFRKKNLPYHNFIKFDEYRNILVKNLELKTSAATKVLSHQQSVFAIPKEHMVKQCRLCKELEVDPSTLFKNAELLQWSPWTLRHRVLLLRELGVSYMHAANVSNFLGSMSLRVGLFKAFMGIPESTNIAENLLRYLDMPQFHVPAPEVLDENLTVNDYHKQCLRCYLKWRLNVSEDDKETIDRLIPNLKHKSVQLIGSLFDVLHRDIGLTIEQIKNHACLSAGSSEDLNRIITEIKTFGNADIKNLIRSYPSLHAMEYDNVTEVIKLLNEHGFTKEAMRRCPEILVMERNDIASRLEILEETPELRVLKNSVNALILISKFTTAQTRIDYLRYLNIKNTTVRSLTGDVRNFERFVRTGVDHTKGREIGYSLEKSLKLGMREIREKIQKHSYWRHVDLIAMHDSLQFLLEFFAPEDLHDSLQLLLYPRERIAESLQNILVVNKESNKENCHDPKKILAICLYEIERDHHFSGDGVWKYDAPQPRRRRSSSKQIESKSSEPSDYSDSEINKSEDGEESSDDSKEIKKRKRNSRKAVNKNVNT